MRMLRFRPMVWSLSMLLLSACGVTSTTSEEATVVGARSQAISWLSAASLSSNIDSYQNTLTQVQNVLFDTDIVEEKDFENGPCVDDTGEAVTLAYVNNPPQDSDIFVCELGLSFDNEVLAQILIHEAIHITGVLNECLTTHITVSAVTEADGTPFRNAYVDDSECQNAYDFSDFEWRIIQATSTSTDSQFNVLDIAPFPYKY